MHAVVLQHMVTIERIKELLALLALLHCRLQAGSSYTCISNTSVSASNTWSSRTYIFLVGTLSWHEGDDKQNPM